MIIIGITGSIGMGKSTIANMLKQFKIPVFDSDKEVGDILENNNEVKKQIYDLWPDVILTETNEKEIDKNLLSRKIFGNIKYRKTLESIIHPKVKERRNIFIKSVERSPIVALDVPLLYETGTDKICDDIFLVHTNEEIQKKRVLARSSMTQKKLDLIKKAQWNDQKKRDKNPYLVTTSYGKFVSFVIITSYLITIFFKKKLLKL